MLNEHSGRLMNYEGKNSSIGTKQTLYYGT